MVGDANWGKQNEAIEWGPFFIHPMPAENTKFSKCEYHAHILDIEKYNFGQLNNNIATWQTNIYRFFNWNKETLVVKHTTQHNILLKRIWVANPVRLLWVIRVPNKWSTWHS